MKIPKYRVEKDGIELAEDEFFVLRSSDLFGATALFAYAHHLQSALELDQLRTIFTAEEREFLDCLAEEVQQLGESWQVDGTATLPD